MKDALTLICVPSVLYCSEPSEGSPMVGGTHTLSVPNSCAVPVAPVS